MVDPKKTKARAAHAARRQAVERPVLIAAYREGLAPSCIRIVRDAGGARVSAIAPGNGELDGEVDTQLRLWCRRVADADYVAKAAMARLRRLKSHEKGCSPNAPAAGDSDSLSQARDAVLAAAHKLGIALQFDEEIADEAMGLVALADAEIEVLRRSGKFRSVTRDYAEYRRQAKARGERPMRYVDWMLKYRADFVREAARELRGI
jgi:hypothetical protein